MGGARRRAARGFLAAALALTATLPAFATEVGVRCKRLTPEQRDELIARIRLSIHSAEPGSQPERVNVECSESEAQVLWELPPTELLEVDEATGLVEGVLDAVERRLASSSVPRQARAASVPPPTPAEQPDLSRPPRPPPLPPSERRKHRAGGLGIGGALDFMLETGQVAFGPRLDLGVGIGPAVALATEGFRIVAGGAHSAFIFDVAIGGGWGAPFDPDRTFGLAALVGMEYFSATRADSVNPSTQAQPTATFTLGPRVAVPVGPGAFCVGVDGRYRASRLEAGDPVDVVLPQFSVIVTVGATLLADPK
jgi:hypothetical protein